MGKWQVWPHGQGDVPIIITTRKHAGSVLVYHHLSVMFFVLRCTFPNFWTMLRSQLFLLILLKSVLTDARFFFQFFRAQSTPSTSNHPGSTSQTEPTTPSSGSLGKPPIFPSSPPPPIQPQSGNEAVGGGSNQQTVGSQS